MYNHVFDRISFTKKRGGAYELRKKFRSIIIFAAVIMLIIPQVPVRAESAPPEINCKAAILIEQSTGKVLYESNADEKLPEASVTKIMTLLLVMEALDGGKISLEDEVVCSDYAASMGGSQIWLEPGETMTVDMLIRATAIGSANDAAVALGEYISGSNEGFVSLMNTRAAELGMKNTCYKNCTGLDEDGHYTSARDIAIAAAELLKHPDITVYTTTWMDSLREGKTELVNTNKLIRSYKGITGLKTGTTDKAGSCLCASAERDGMSLISVVLGASDSKERFNGSTRLLDYGFANYEKHMPVINEDIAAEITVTGGMKKSVALEVCGIEEVLIPKGRAQEIEISVECAQDVAAPVENGQTVGYVRLSLDGDEFACYSIKTRSNVDKVSVKNVFSKLISAFLLL